ncbi:MAG: CPXCG motif-containing cysteine-rich protein [Oceanococcaceae bacterium]
MNQVEVEESCPYCGEYITLLMDDSAGEQEYIEDCFVCCRPIHISIRHNLDDDALFLSVRAEDD